MILVENIFAYGRHIQRLSLSFENVIVVQKEALDGIINKTSSIITHDEPSS